MTQEAWEDRLLAVLCLTTRTNLSRLPSTTGAAGLAQPARPSEASSDHPWCGPLR